MIDKKNVSVIQLYNDWTKIIVFHSSLTSYPTSQYILYIYIAVNKLLQIQV